ncbi:MAG: hypothetical protein IKF52_05180 [Clostridia bacterium]|nr:hypothetical protein [Clostridia bacterium]
MKLGTIAFNKKVYNLDFMTKDEIKDLVDNIDKEKIKTKKELKKIIR